MGSEMCIRDRVPLTQREIAKEMGISRSYVSRIEKGALQKIAEYLRLCV